MGDPGKGWNESFGSSTVGRAVGFLLLSFFAVFPVLPAVVVVSWIFRQIADWWATGKVTRIEREVQTVKLIERVQLGEISTREFEQLTGFLDAERLGLIEAVYNPETARRRRALARKIGASATDGQSEPLDVSLDELLAVPRSAWSAERLATAAAHTP